MMVQSLIDGVLQAFGQLNSNRLRTLLSLLGITIGIFCIIAVKSAVSSLEDNIRDSFEKLGNDVIYITKMPWAENPHENYWKYLRRPNPNIDDLRAVQDRARTMKAAALSVFIGPRTAKNATSYVKGAFVVGCTYDYADILKVPFSKGRWFSHFEYQKAKNVVILGSEVAQELFSRADPIGKEITFAGQKFLVVGVIEPSGDGIINVMNFDQALLLGFETAKKIANVRSDQLFGNNLMVEAAEGIAMDELRDEVTGILRNQRRLSPKTDDDFALNELSILSGLLDNFFGVLNLAGWIIGMFAIVVGMFSVANIMFVSVKERTSIIGVKMALGAKRANILWEFLVEATVICIIGGVAGLLFVYLVMLAITHWIEFDMHMSLLNAMTGLGLSIMIGILSGVLPALQASRLDPVEAMRR